MKIPFWRQCLNPRDPDYLEPEEDGIEDEEDELIAQYAEEWAADNPADDYIMSNYEDYINSNGL